MATSNVSMNLRTPSTMQELGGGGGGIRGIFPSGGWSELGCALATYTAEQSGFVMHTITRVKYQEGGTRVAGSVPLTKGERRATNCSEHQCVYFVDYTAMHQTAGGTLVRKHRLLYSIGRAFC